MLSKQGKNKWTYFLNANSTSFMAIYICLNANCNKHKQQEKLPCANIPALGGIVTFYRYPSTAIYRVIDFTFRMQMLLWLSWVTRQLIIVSWSSMLEAHFKIETKMYHSSLCKHLSICIIIFCSYLDILSSEQTYTFTKKCIDCSPGLTRQLTHGE